jgi:hypothetical protein
MGKLEVKLHTFLTLALDEVSGQFCAVGIELLVSIG